MIQSIFFFPQNLPGSNNNLVPDKRMIVKCSAPANKVKLKSNKNFSVLVFLLTGARGESEIGDKIYILNRDYLQG